MNRKSRIGCATSSLNKPKLPITTMNSTIYTSISSKNIQTIGKYQIGPTNMIYSLKYKHFLVSLRAKCKTMLKGLLFSAPRDTSLHSYLRKTINSKGSNSVPWLSSSTQRY